MHGPTTDGRAAEPQIGRAVLGMPTLRHGGDLRCYETDPGGAPVTESIIVEKHRLTLQGTQAGAAHVRN